MALEHLFTATFERVSGIPADRVVNTFAFGRVSAIDPVGATEWGAATEALNDFYNSDNTSQPIAYYLSAELSRDAGSVVYRGYDIEGHLDGTPHGSPVFEEVRNLAASADGSMLPAECAVVLTTRGTDWATTPVETADGADAGSLIDRPRQRRSGRTFLGPLNPLAGESVSGLQRVAGAFKTDILDAAERLQTDLIAAGWIWSVWSRVNAAFVPITHVQVDNAFDTMRKRGPDALTRTTRLVFTP